MIVLVPMDSGTEAQHFRTGEEDVDDETLRIIQEGSMEGGKEESAERE